MKRIYFLFKGDIGMSLEEKVHSFGFGLNSRCLYNGVWEFTDLDLRVLKMRMIDCRHNNPHALYPNYYEEHVNIALLNDLKSAISQFPSNQLLDNNESLYHIGRIEKAFASLIKGRHFLDTPILSDNITNGTLIRVTLLDEQAEELTDKALAIINRWKK